jgi:hypothetical protein
MQEEDLALEEATIGFLQSEFALSDAPLSLLSLLFPSPNPNPGGGHEELVDIMADVSMVTSIAPSLTDDDAFDGGEDADLTWFLQSITHRHLDSLSDILSQWSLHSSTAAGTHSHIAYNVVRVLACRIAINATTV